MKVEAKSGYLLVMVMIALAGCTVLITALYTQLIVTRRAAQSCLLQAQLRAAARTGIELAKAILSGEQLDEEVRTSAADPYLCGLVAACNNWHTYKITLPDRRVIECRIFITCEQSKANLNALFNFAAKGGVQLNTQAGTLGALIQTAYGSLLQESNQLAQLMLKHAQQVGRPFLNLAQAVPAQVPALASLPLWPAYAPSAEEGGEEKKKTPPWSLIATVYTATTDQGINPLFLTPELCSLVGFASPDAAGRSSVAQKITRRRSVAEQWNSTLAPLYNVKAEALKPALQQLFSTEFEALTFSVVSYALLDSTTQGAMCHY
jgi:hypothetical protein